MKNLYIRYCLVSIVLATIIGWVAGKGIIWTQCVTHTPYASMVVDSVAKCGNNALID